MDSKLKRILTLSLLFSLCLHCLRAQNELPLAEDLKGLKYRMIGPQRGGRVSTATGIPQDMFTFYMGTTGGGIWKTTDAGISWKNISDGFLKVGSIGAIAVAPSDPNIIYAGTGSPDPRGNVSAGDGIYKSTDAGQTWEHVGLPKAGQIGKVVIHPNDPDRVYVAVLGNVFGPNPERGVYQSKDGGQTWEKTLFVSERTGAIELVMAPDNPRVLYAGMWTAERKPWTLIDGSEEGGLWRSKDGGNTWKKVASGLPDGLLGRIGITISPANPKRIWAQMEAKEEKKGGLYRSDDGGKSWKRISRDHQIRQRAWYYSRIYAHPTEENTIYALNVGFLKSIDGGKTFERIRVPHGDNHCLWINPHRPDVMIESNDGGACITFNGGKTWTTQNNQPTAEFYRVSVDNQFPYRVYGAQQDNSTITVPSRNEGALTPLSNWYSIGGGESGHIAVDPRNPDLIYAGTYIGVITRKDLATGHGKNIVAYPQMHDGQAPRDIRFRFQWNAPIRISPHNPEVIYHCSQYVHRTTNGGKDWETISPDLTTNNDAYQDIPGGPIQHDHTGVELYTTIFAFEESPHEAGELWAGTDDGRLHISRDNGANWTEITPPQMPKEGTINTIELSTHDPGRAFVAVYRYRQNDFKPYIFQTDDHGKSWALLTNGKNGIPNEHFVRVVREDPHRKGLLYAGTEFGMYFSWNGGRQWHPFQLNLPITPITDMLIKNKDLVVATQGRSFWILDDLSPLHDLSSEIAAKEAHLFAPEKAYRNQFRNFREGPDPAPNGALIDFYLKEKDSSLVRVSVLDAEGQVRKVYSTKPDKNKKEAELKVKQGLNRLQWNLRYEAPEVQENAVFSLANLSGVIAPPGTHGVVLEVGNSRQEQSFEVSKDPRWSQSEADLKAQYELTMQVKSLLNECHAAIGKIRSVRTQINDLAKRCKEAGYEPSIGKKAHGLAKILTELEKQFIQIQSESGQDPINYPSMIDDQIAYLYSVVNGQDDRPNAGAYQRFEDLGKELQPLMAELEAFQKKELANFMESLKAAGVDLIISSNIRP